jgi:hypothetical protein
MVGASRDGQSRREGLERRFDKEGNGRIVLHDKISLI